MAQEIFTRESFWAELDKLGEEAVRTRVVTGAFSKLNSKLPLAEEWLRRRDFARTDASQSEQIDIARSAKDAAWAAAKAAERAADEAERANKRATIAQVIAAISIIVAILGWFKPG